MLEYYDLTSADLHIGGRNTRDLVKEFGTPLYVYDLGIVEEKYNKVKKAFPDFDIFFSVKANPNLAVASCLRSLGAGAELASDGELYLMQQAGYKPGDIVFAGPGKTEDELTAAIRAGIYAINAESAVELMRIDRISQELDRRTKVCLRVNTAEGVDEAAERMVGGPSKFGFDEEDLVAEVKSLNLSNTEIMGFHVYTASGVLNEDALFANFQRTVALSAALSDALGIELKAIDFGGGFGVPYFANERELDLELLRNKVYGLLNSPACPINPSKVRLIWELGRYLVAECGVYITRVLDVKESRGRTYVITDGGMNQMIRPVFMDLNHPVKLLNRLREPDTLVADIGGPCCTPIDMLAKGISLPIPQIGDLVGIFNAGAYGFSMSMLYFLSHALPAEVVIYNGEPRLARRRGTVTDSMINQIPVV